MTEDQKNKASAAHGKLATWLQGLGVPANYAKIGSGIIIGAAIGALATCQQSCGSSTSVQLQAIEKAYTTLGGNVKYRLIPVDHYKK